MTILDGTDPAALISAAQRLAADGLVAFPTETVYGLGARADHDRAVAAIFEAKGRPADHPLIVHVLDAGAAAPFVKGDIPKLARSLIDAFWPGPVTVIVARAPGFATAAAGGQDTIGLRAPAHPVARALLEQCAALGIAGLAAPSANRFGGVSPTSAAHVVQEFGADMLVLDGGDCEVGIESCIVDCSRGVPVLLRPGRIARAQLEAALGQRLVGRDAAAPRAPGSMAVHYAPKAKIRLMDSAQLKQALGVLPEGIAGLAVYSRTVPVRRRELASRTMPDDPGAAAHELFRALREFDACGVRLIWIETPPDTPEWEGVTDRLLRAATA